MDPFVTPALINGGLSIFGSILGGSSKPEGPPQWLLNLLAEEAQNRNYSGFLPDRSAYEQSANAGIADVMKQLPTSLEAFRGNLASRGLYGSGEGIAQEYGQVIDPIFKSAASISAQSNLAFTQATQQGNIAAEQMHQESLNRLTNFYGQTVVPSQMAAWQNKNQWLSAGITGVSNSLQPLWDFMQTNYWLTKFQTGAAGGQS